MATRCELAKEYFKANPNPIQKLCPNVRQYWRIATGTMLWDNESLERREVNSHSYHPSYNWTAEELWTTPRSEYEGFYLRHVADLDALEVAKIRVNGNRGKNGEKKVWHYSPYGERYLIFKGDTSVYEPSGFAYAGEKYYSKMLLDFIGSDCRCAIHSPVSHEEWKRFMGHAIESKWYNDCNNPSPQMYKEAYQRNFMPRKTSGRAKEIASYAFADYDVDPVREFDYHMLVEIPDENYCVLRCFKSVSSWEIRNGAEPGFKEYLRIFIDTKGKPSSLTYENGKWKIISNSGWYADHKHHVVNPEKFEEWKPLKYIFPILDMEDLTPKSVMTILRHPIVEQLAKAGYKHTARSLMQDNQVSANMKDIFLAEKETKQSFFRVLGVNKFLLNKAEELSAAMEEQMGGRYGRWSSGETFIKRVKELYDRHDISDLSQESVDMIANAIGNDTTRNMFEYIPTEENHSYWYYRRNHTEPHITEGQRRLILKLFRMAQRRPDIIRIWLDTIESYHRLINKPDLEIFEHWENAHDIEQLHDDLVALKLEEDRNRQAAYDEAEKKRLEKMKEKFEKLQPERIAKFEEEGDKFCIRVPHELEEIKQEGMILSHCVGGYTTRHANGDTNIIFLRKKEAPLIPFYTIEIQGNHLVQIHGSHNRWLGNVPEAVPFVYQWLKKRGIRFSEDILLNKGIGYSKGNTQLPREALTAVVTA